MNKRIIYSLMILGQLVSQKLFVQGQNNFNYANLNSTSISAEYLDEKMILETVDNNKGWNGSWTKNNWLYFNFNQEIEINTLELFFYENTCLNDCKLEFQLITKDTTIDIIVNSLSLSQRVDINSDYLILKRKDVYPRGPGHLNEIKILSNTAPISLAKGDPIIKIGKGTRLKIKYFIQGLSKSEVKENLRMWKKRKKFYSREIKSKLPSHEKEFFENRIFYGNDEKWFCYKIKSYIPLLSDRSLTELFDDCKCDVRESFFGRKMKPTESMNQRNFNFLGNEISYNSDSAEIVLLNYLEGGDAWAGHAIPHLCLMGKSRYIDKIEALKNDANVFTQVQAIEGLVYFNETKKALEISKKIYQNEIQSIVNDSISSYGCYASIALRIINEYYPSETLPLLLDLFKKYRSLYPKEMELGEHWSNVYYYGADISKRVESIQGCDDSILGYIESYLVRFPHLTKNPTLKEFRIYINEKAVHNNQ